MAAAPVIMKLLSIVGTAAMFMVGGGILAHGMPWLPHIPVLIDMLVGVVAGGLCLALLTAGQKVMALAR